MHLSTPFQLVQNIRTTLIQGKILAPFKLSKPIQVAVAASILLVGATLSEPALRLFKLPGIQCQSAMADAGSLDSSLKSWLDLPQAELIHKLEDFRAAAFQPERQKQRAAYVLARTLQKTVQTKSESQRGSVDSDNVEKAKKTIVLYEEASKIEGLWERCQNHIVEVATAAQLEPELRAHLEMLKGREKDANDKTADLYQIAQSYYRTQDFDKAEPLFAKLQKEAPGSNAAAGSNYYLGKIDIARAMAEAQGSGQPSQNGAASGNVPLSNEAVTYFRNYLATAPNGKSAREIADTLLASANGAAARAAGASPAIPPSDRDLFAEVYYNAGNYDGALQQWALAGSPGHLVQKAYCLARLGRTKESKDMLLKAVSAHDPASKTAWDAVTTNLTNPLTKAQTLDFWKQVLAAHPAKADTALWNIGTRTPLPEAQPYFQKILADYPTSEYAPESVWWLVWSTAKTQHAAPTKLAAAVSLAHTGMTKYPNTKAIAKVAYWAGKMDELLHQPEQAKLDYDYAAKNFPSYYYGLRAGVRLNVLRASTKMWDKGWSTKPDRQLKDSWSWPDYTQLTSTERVLKKYGKTVAELISLQQLDEAIAELPNDVEPEYKAALRAANDDYAGAIWSAGKNLEGRPAGDERWQMSYPRMFASDVMQGARANHLDPLLIHALIREESRYNSMALSRSKAIGLTQLMPGTAFGVAKRLGVPLGSLSEVYKPDTNIKLGSNYLSSVLQRAQNNALLAVASYNGGPNAVQSWLREHNTSGYPDFDYFVENIPFRETRDYVRKVFGSFWVYEKVYAEQ
jgi:soluble lytic murein transglycosylase